MQYPKASYGKVVKIHDERISLDPSIFKQLDLDNQNILLIFQPKPPIIRIYDVNLKYIYKMIVLLDNVIPSFIGALGSVFVENDIYPIHTSALCFFENICSYEAYLNPQELTENIDLIKEQIIQIEGVQDVIFYEIE